MASAPRFAEWMVNYALAWHLKSDEQDQFKKWFFSLPVTAVSGAIPVSRLCGFDWLPGETHWARDRGLSPYQDRGSILPEEFRKKYWNIRPDFRFWTKGKERQLIVEGKGRDIKRGEMDQARRYFDYLKGFPAEGAVIYLIPGQARRSLSLLRQVAGDTAINYGVADWEDDDFLQKISIGLVHGIAESIAGHSKLLEKALSYSQKKH